MFYKRFFSFPLFWWAQVAHQKWAMWANRSGRSPKMSDSLTSLRGNERSWANRSSRSPKMCEWVNRSIFWANPSFAHFWANNEQFARKTHERIPSPALTTLTQCWHGYWVRGHVVSKVVDNVYMVSTYSHWLRRLGVSVVVDYTVTVSVKSTTTWTQQLQGLRKHLWKTSHFLLTFKEQTDKKRAWVCLHIQYQYFEQLKIGG